MPVLLARLPGLDARIRMPLAQALLRRSERPDGVVGWNASRSRAHDLLRRQGPALLAYAAGRMP